ncbi:hypothetical protein CMUS01_12382 [Colletotrichum musicola]|uniref:Uncharacterized protein n=1 Tax=Colletotrichum musicola TaxID=2175873 RepID=A0A8H6JM74_9PEZI|nr:hypothetical protein CMUS01_12382 [Colletotrichum musicola]
MPNPGGVPGSALELLLRKEGLKSKEGLAVVNHIINYETPGRATRLVWKHDHGSLRHDYLLICVVLPHAEEEEESWVRLERMGDDRYGKSRGARETAPDGLTFAAAPNKKDLSHAADRTIYDTALESPSPTVVALAHTIRIVHEADLNYTLFLRLHHANCWWFAWQTFRTVVAEFKLEGEEKTRILRKARMKPLGNGKLLCKEIKALGAVGYAVKAWKMFPVAVPVVVVGGAVATGLLVAYDLRRTSKKIREQVREHTNLQE